MRLYATEEIIILFTSAEDASQFRLRMLERFHIEYIEATPRQVRVRAVGELTPEDSEWIHEHAVRLGAREWEQRIVWRFTYDRVKEIVR